MAVPPTLNSPSKRGGKRRKHVERVFTPEDALNLRRLRAIGVAYSILMQATGRGRDVLRKAIHGLAPYDNIGAATTIPTERSAWSTADRRPPRKDVYLRLYPAPFTVKQFCYWDGRHWYTGTSVYSGATRVTTKSGRQDLPWRPI